MKPIVGAIILAAMFIAPLIILLFKTEGPKSAWIVLGLLGGIILLGSISGLLFWSGT